MGVVIELALSYKLFIAIILMAILSYMFGYLVATGFSRFLVQTTLYPPSRLGPINFTGKGYGDIVYIYVFGVCCNWTKVDDRIEITGLNVCSEVVYKGNISKNYFCTTAEYGSVGVLLNIVIYSTFLADNLLTYFIPLIFLIMSIAIASLNYKYLLYTIPSSMLAGILGSYQGLTIHREILRQYIMSRVYIYLVELILAQAIVIIIWKIYMHLSKR